MGGMGTYDIVCRYPNTFAAAVPICGGIHTDRLNETVKDIPWRIYHGDADPIVPVQNSRAAYQTLLNIGAEVEYIEYPGVNHESWNFAFAEADFLPWLFSHVNENPDYNSIQSVNSDEIKINLFGENLFIQTAKNGMLNVKLYNLAGQVVYVFPQERHNALEMKTYSLPTLTKGVYLVEVYCKGQTYTCKIIR